MPFNQTIRVILSNTKDLITSTNASQIFRFAQQLVFTAFRLTLTGMTSGILPLAKISLFIQRKGLYLQKSSHQYRNHESEDQKCRHDTSK